MIIGNAYSNKECLQMELLILKDWKVCRKNIKIIYIKIIILKNILITSLVLKNRGF